METKLNAKARLAMLGKKQVDLLPELRVRLEMYAVNSDEVSRALSGNGVSPKHDAIRTATDAILSEWERG